MIARKQFTRTGKLYNTILIILVAGIFFMQIAIMYQFSKSKEAMNITMQEIGTHIDRLNSIIATKLDNN